MSRIEKLLEFLESSPGDNFLQHALALEYIKIGRDGDARLLFEAILDRDPAYIGSYYHLGKLLERQGDTGVAIGIYKKGMDKAKEAGDRHSYNELQGALEDLED
ncbi:MAG: hypothetical protein U0T56_02160 [Ferruginibacter sp.]|jgi:tetratricopeptide (TPR) repeat protein